MMKKEHGISWRECFTWALLVGLIFPLAGARATTALSTNDYAIFGQRLEDHFKHADKLFYVRSYDMDSVAHQILPPTMADQSDAAEFNDSFERSFRQGMESQLGAIRSFKYLRVIEKDGEPCLLMRMSMTNRAVSYMGFFLQRDDAGATRIKDAYNYMSGERITATGRRMVIPILAESNKSVLERMFEDKPDVIKYAPQWEKMTTDATRGQYQQALDEYDQLPPSLQAEKFVLAQELRAALNNNQEKYMAAVALWRKTYPDDPALGLITVDYFVYLKEYDKALEAVDQVDKAVGGDPYQDFVRGTIYQVMKDTNNAEHYYVRAVSAEPDLITSALLAIRIRSIQGNYAGCIEILDELTTKGGFIKYNLNRSLHLLPACAGLLQSDEYLKWYPDPGDDLPPASTPMEVPQKPNY